VLSGIPFDGPIGAVRIAFSTEGTWIPHPTYEEGQESTFEMVVAGRALGDNDVAISMVEAGGTEASWPAFQDGAPKVDEDVLAGGLEAAKQYILQSINAQRQLMAAVGVKPPMAYSVSSDYTPEILTAMQAKREQILATQIISDKTARLEAEAALRDALVAELAPGFADVDGAERQLKAAFRSVTKAVVRSRIVNEGARIDGRGPKDIRALSSEVGVLPSVHGSGLFQRGETQVLTVTTLGMPRMEQMLDTIGVDDRKRYMHHYNFPPFSTGETGRVGSPKRREIGHGALAERALVPVVPDVEEWPYTIRVVCDVLACNGSTSMASTCGSTLALMDAGVPIKAPVAGIAMGLITDDTGERFAVLTDIQGMEDFSGDMDFKVAGTAEGITALQLDTKIQGIPREVFVQGFDQARDARLHILGKINEAITAPRGELSQYAPRIISLKIDPEQIGGVIGPGGKNIKKICADTGAKIDIEQDGTVHITSVDGAGGDMAKSIIEGMTKTLSPGEIYEGTVVRFLQFGAFVSLPGGKDALVHVSQISDPPPGRPDENLKLGDVLRVRVTEIDPQGRVNATARGLEEPFDPANPEPGRPPRPSAGGGRGGDRGGRGGDRGGRGGDRGGRGDRGERAPRDAERPAPAASPEADEDGDEMPRARFRPRR